MKRITLPILLILLSILLVGQSSRNRSTKTELIDNFSIKTVPVAVSSEDSIKIITVLEIPYSSLQFIKDKTGFRAEYEATIVVQDDENHQFDRAIWQETVHADNYLETVSLQSHITHGNEMVVPLGNVRVITEITDLETHNRGYKTNIHQFDIEDDSPTLFQPVILVEKEGDWGFGKNLFPLISGAKADNPETIYVNMSGHTYPEPFDLNVSLMYNKEQIWTKSLSIDSDSKWFVKTISIPSDTLVGIQLEMNVTLSQGDFEETKSTVVRLKHKGLSPYIRDMNLALEQMKYILSTEEKSRIRKAKNKQKEKLFFDLWKDRDPTPNTPFNELMEEYYRRVEFSNEHFSNFQQGWRSDMGMIYILMGPPDDVERINMPHARNTYEIWYYHRINERYTFVDPNGFGDYRLNEPYVGFPSSGW